MENILQIARAEGWDTLPADSPENKVFKLALGSEPKADPEVELKEVVVKKAAKKTSTKKKRKK